MRRVQIELPEPVLLALMRRSVETDVPLTSLIVEAVERFLLLEKQAPTSGEKCCTVEFSYELPSSPGKTMQERQE
jgi:hypothetical protein